MFALLQLSVLILSPQTWSQTISPHHLYTFRGQQALDQFGYSAELLGDITGDGFDEIIIGAPQILTNGSGYVSVLSGANGAELYRWNGDDPVTGLSDRFGYALAVIGDLDQDTVDDFVVGAPHDDDGGDQAGSIRVFSGATGNALLTIPGSAGDLLGERIAAAGDVNADGVVDILVGSPSTNIVRVYSGATILALSQQQAVPGALMLYSLSGTGQFGSALSALGDLDDDGRSDFAVGAPATATGTVFLYSGLGNSLATISGNSSGDLFGASIEPIGDVNGDSFDEIAIGAPRASQGDSNSGTVSLLSGSWIHATAQGTIPPGPKLVWELDGSTTGEMFGFSIATAGDFDADGAPDVLVGGTSALNLQQPGTFKVISGTNAQTLMTIAASSDSILNAWTVSGNADVNADGHPDVLIACPRCAEGGAGRVSIYSGAELALVADDHELSVTDGGAVTLQLSAGSAFANHIYVVAGTWSGLPAGIDVTPNTWPLTIDDYFWYTLGAPQHPQFASFQGVLDASGQASAQIGIPSDSKPQWSGLTLHHAFAVLDPLGTPTLQYVSNPVPLTLTIDACDVVDPQLDCNTNGILDTCDIANEHSDDCNNNTIPDSCDIASGSSLDNDQDAIPDECTTIIYVDAQATGANNGTSWQHAYKKLQNALSNPPDYAQVWVARGTYTPHASNPKHSFLLQNKVAVYGGFAGNETELTQRDWQTNTTVLSGDLAGDDQPGFTNYADNSYSVLNIKHKINESAVLDGFTIRGGSSTNFQFCAGHFSDCQGGAAYSLGSPTMRNCILRDNYGGYKGGAIYNAGNPTFIRCTFINNLSSAGGALYNDVGSNPTLINYAFFNNEAISGGAMYSFGNPNDLSLVVNGLFVGNTASDSGGTFDLVDSSTRLVNCTLVHNTSTNDVGGLRATANSQIEILNSILWANSAGNGTPESMQISGGQAQVFYSCLEGWSGTLTGAGSFGVDPQFINPNGPDNLPGTLDDNVQLSPASPCKDAGDTLLLPADIADLDEDGDDTESTSLDLANSTRAIGGSVDQGAYESDF